MSDMVPLGLQTHLRELAYAEHEGGELEVTLRRAADEIARLEADLAKRTRERDEALADVETWQKTAVILGEQRDEARTAARLLFGDACSHGNSVEYRQRIYQRWPWLEDKA